jgi:hypothetical protein
MHEETKKKPFTIIKINVVERGQRHGIEYKSMPGVTRKPLPATSNETCISDAWMTRRMGGKDAR